MTRRWTTVENDRIVIVHTRIVNAELAGLGARLETLGSATDRMWSTKLVGPLVLDNGLNIGSSGGHAFGSVPYTVIEHEPGRRVRFGFVDFVLDGWHEFSLQPTDTKQPQVTHRLEARATIPARLALALRLTSSHDGVIEGIFDNLQREYGTEPEHPARVPLSLRLGAKLTARRLSTPGFTNETRGR